MKRFNVCAAAVIVVMTLAAVPASAASLANGSFEDPVTTDGPPFVGSWEAFSGGTTAQAVNSTAMPRTGAQNLALSIANTDNTFAGVFQDVPNLTPGTPVTFSGFQMTPSSPLGVGVEFRIEWRNASTNSEVSRTPNSSPVPTGQYTPFSLTATVPSGADTARVVYAIQSFGPEPSNNGVVYVDDVSFVPEPTTAAFSLGALGLACLRRRRR
jgi:MYXO-CTERM domain-containing protein